MYKNTVELKKLTKSRIRRRIRKKISGTSDRPRVYFFKSNRYLYAQVVDDTEGKVILSASTLEKEFREKQKNTKNVKSSEALGKILAQRLRDKKIKQIVFDRGIYPYHGKVKALAEAIRKEGIQF
ncbi:MAG: 50S ribosomal protein L18 [Acidobacteriota bacterium]